MRRFILTGAPGSGKTSILRVLRAKGYAVIDEAATDVIAAEQLRGVDEPWRDPRFIDKIIELQRSRQLGEAAAGTGDQLYDRSPVCTLALARYLEQCLSAVLTAEIERIISQGIYQRRVFFIRPLGFIEPTAARRISYQDALKFERAHESEYSRLGFELVDIEAADVAARVAAIEGYLAVSPPFQAGSGVGVGSEGSDGYLGGGA